MVIGWVKHTTSTGCMFVGPTLIVRACGIITQLDLGRTSRKVASEYTKIAPKGAVPD